MSKLDEVRRRREERKELLKRQHEEQLAVDFEALDALEIEHGDANVAALQLAYEPGLVALAVARAATSAEIKRYRARVKPDKDGVLGDFTVAAEELADSCVVYPDKEAWATLKSRRPAFAAQLGSAVVKLAGAKAEDEGKR